MQIFGREIVITPAWKKGLIWGAAAVAGIAVLIFGWKTFFYHPPVTGIYTAPPPAKGMPVVPTKLVSLAVPIKVYDKKQAAKKMSLPDEIVSDPKKELVATGRVEPPDSDYTTTIAAITDTSTGVTALETKTDRSLFGFGGSSSIGALAGVSNKGQTALVYANQDLLRIGPVKFGVAGGGGIAGTEAIYGAFAHIHGSW
jgi:hypothetical protein